MFVSGEGQKVMGEGHGVIVLTVTRKADQSLFLVYSNKERGKREIGD